MTILKALIADDHAVVRRGLKQILDETSDIVVCGEATDSVEALEQVKARNWDVLVLDITMPGRSGLDILKEVKQLAPKLPVLILSMHSEDQFASRVLQAGASGYLPKESAPEELVKAIRKVCRGERYISSTQADKRSCIFESSSEKLPHESLSYSEYQVLRRLASGKTVTQIAYEANLSVKTIRAYRTRILEKMRMESNAEMTHYAIKKRLVD